MRSRRKRIHYNGGSTLISVSAKTYEAAIAHQAREAIIDRRTAQQKFDAARKWHQEAIDSLQIDEAQKEIFRQSWRRIEESIAEIRQEAAMRRITARELRKKLDALTKGTDTH